MVVDAPVRNGMLNQMKLTIDEISRMASAALGPDPTAVPSENVEEREEEEVPLRRKRCQKPGNLREEQPSERLFNSYWLRIGFRQTSKCFCRARKENYVNEANFIERMTAIKEKKKRALADLRYRALKGKPMKQSEVTQMMRTLVKNQWCAAPYGTITMTSCQIAMTKQQLIDEYEYICRRLEKDRLLSAQYNLFRPKPVITEPPSKRQRVERATSQPASVPAATSHTADDPDSAGGGTSNPAGSAFGAPVSDSTVPTPAAMDSAGSHHESGVSPFADSADSSSPPNVSTDHIPLDVLFESTSGGINDFFLTSDADEQIGDWCIVVVDSFLNDEIVDPRVKVETIPESAASPPRSRRKHLEVRSEVRVMMTWKLIFLLFRMVHSKIGRLYFRLNPDVDVGLDLWRDVNLLCQSLHSDDVEDFWRTQDEWIVSSWKLYPKSSVHVLDLTNGKTVYMFVDNVIQTVQAGLRESYECLASAPIIVLYNFGVRACTARQMVLSSPWLTANKESGSPLQTALEQTALGKDFSNPAVTNSCCKDWKLLFFNVAACFVAAGYLVSAGTCFCCYSILLLREDLSRNLELTESKPSLGEDCWDKLKTTKCRFCC
ncbi:hypothetical protein Tco_1409248 [Tanacetum coccineum]